MKRRGTGGLILKSTTCVFEIKQLYSLNFIARKNIPILKVGKPLSYALVLWVLKRIECGNHWLRGFTVYTIVRLNCFTYHHIHLLKETCDHSF